ncbi:MAG: MATE family efflux transporter [Marinobacterium sp.]|nr:MATE family efflux transporter [Marinobacterium sp.]
MSSRPDLLSGPIRPTLVRMTVPMMLGIVSLMLFNLADVYFVSQLGIEPLAALGFTFPVTFTIVSLAIGFGIGTSATLARLIGAGEQSRASTLATDNLLMTALIVILISLISLWLIDPVFRLMGAEEALLPLIRSYMSIWFVGSTFLVVNMVGNSAMRAGGDTVTPARLMAFSSALNLLLDPLFIFGAGPVPAMGIEGAALASVLSWGVATLVVLHLLYHRRQLLVMPTLVPSRIMQNWLLVMKIGLPAALSNMMTPIAGAVMTAVVAQHGPGAVAAFGVGNRLESLSLLVCLALSMTLPPFISQNFGAGQVERVVKGWQGAVRFALGWQLLVYIVLVVVRDPVASLFSDDADVRELIALLLLIVPIGFGCQAVAFLTASAFNALHQPMRAMRLSVTRLFALYVPLGWVGSQLAGLDGMFAGLVLANVLTALLAGFWMNRHLRQLQAK